MPRRIVEIILGIAITFCLIARKDGNEFIIWYILTPKVLKAITWIVLFFVAGRLLFGKYKDYSAYCYRLLARLLGTPSKHK